MIENSNGVVPRCLTTGEAEIVADAFIAAMVEEISKRYAGKCTPPMSGLQYFWPVGKTELAYSLLEGLLKPAVVKKIEAQMPASRLLLSVGVCDTNETVATVWPDIESSQPIFSLCMRLAFGKQLTFNVLTENC